MKETTIVTLAIVVCATVLVALGKIDATAFSMATGAAGIGKGLQGAADKFKPKGG